MVVEFRETLVRRREPLVDKACPVCGRGFRGLGRQRYCSQQCQQRAYYVRRADERRAARRARYRRQKQERAKEGSDGGE
jgi:hypothetical protein